ncbi:MAG: nitrous oxide reductase family maturation protein NosD, partial [Alphaproteobacteria bacterium]
ADMPYRPNDLMDHILWTQPAARLLLGSPAVQLIRWAQSKFPSLMPGGVVDNYPLMAPTAKVSLVKEDAS